MLGKPKGYSWAAQQSSSFGINIEDLEEERAFSQLDKKRDIVRRTTFFCNKELLFCMSEKFWWDVQMLCYGLVEDELFRFPAFFPLIVRSF